MTAEQLKGQLAQAKEEARSGNLDLAEQLANTVLSHLDSLPDEDVGDRVSSEQKVEYISFRAGALLTLASVSGQRGDFTLSLEQAHDVMALATEHHLHEIKATCGNVLGLVYSNLDMHDNALEYYTQALTEYQELGKKSERARVAVNIGQLYQAIGSYDLALEYYAQALATFREYGQDLLIATVSGNIALVYTHRSTYDKALEYFTQALAIYQEHSQKADVARTTGHIGIVYYSLGIYDNALENFTSAVTAYRELGDKSNVAHVTGNIGNVYLQLGSYAKALEYYTQALTVHQELGQKSTVALVTENIGCIYNSLGSYDKALVFFTQALGIFQETDGKSGVASVFGNMGRSFFERKEYDKALEYQKRALEVTIELGDRYQMGYWLTGIGNTLSAMGNRQEAMEYLQHALRLRRDELQSNAGVAETLIAIGILLAEQNNYDEAMKYLSEALMLAEEIGEQASACIAHKELASLLKKQGVIAESYRHFENYHELEKVIQSEEAVKQSLLLEHRRRVEEREKEMAIAKAAADAKHQATEALLHNVLPPSITKRLLDHEKPIADKADHVSVFFSDIVGFTSLSQRISAKELVAGLNDVFTDIDVLAKQFGIEKIKTIGDAYMAVCGVPIAREDHARCIAEFALSLQRLFHDGVSIAGENISMRIGLHTGEVVAGVIGEHKFAYDLWGDAVNTASRMESHGEPGKIHVTEEFKHAVETLHATSLHATSLHATSLHATSLRFIERGEMDIKGKGLMRTYFLERYME